MFPNSVEFYVREKEAERHTDVEQIRLIKQIPHRSLWPLLGRSLCWLGRQLIGLGEKFREHPARIQPTTEQSIP